MPDESMKAEQDTAQAPTPSRQETRQHRPQITAESDHEKARTDLPKLQAKLREMAEHKPQSPFDNPFESQAADNLKRIADGIDSLVRLVDSAVGKWLDEFERTRR